MGREASGQADGARRHTHTHAPKLQGLDWQKVQSGKGDERSVAEQGAPRW